MGIFAFYNKVERIPKLLEKISPLLMQNISPSIHLLLNCFKVWRETFKIQHWNWLQSPTVYCKMGLCQQLWINCRLYAKDIKRKSVSLSICLEKGHCNHRSCQKRSHLVWNQQFTLISKRKRLKINIFKIQAWGLKLASCSYKIHYWLGSQNVLQQTT